MMQKNMVLAVVLSMMFMIGWYTFVVPKNVPRGNGSPAAEKPAVNTAVTAAETRPPKQNEKPASYDTYTLETDDVKVVFSAEGAGIEAYYLKERGGEVNLIPEAIPGGRNLFFYSQGGPYKRSGAPQRVSLDGNIYNKVSFVSSGGAQPVETKTYYLAEKGFLHKIEFEIVNTSKREVNTQDTVLTLGRGMKMTGGKDELKEARAIGYKDFTVTNFKKGGYGNDYTWIGLDSRYFLAAVLDTTALFGRLEVVKEKNSLPSVNLYGKDQPLKSGGKASLEALFYIGPKSYYELKALNLKLEEAVNFGFFGFLSKYALKALRMIEGVTKNYGFAIVILTVFLQILLFPLTAKSFKASLGMKKLQPQIKILQEKYKQDPKRLNVEMLNLYKTSKTNPFGGCLPMILQIPVFWALFTTLRGAYELRNAPFIFWIKDLSAPDPFYVLPVLMGIGMFIQQKFMAVTADPTQAKMAYIMPVVLTVLFINFPAGLVLYWLTNNIVTGVQQYFMLKHEDSK